MPTGGVAQAADNGQRTGPVQFWAENLGNCQVKFTLTNEPNITSYTLDWRIDDEPLRDVDYADFEVGRTGGMHTTVEDAPRWPDDIPTMGENTMDNFWMERGRPLSTVTYTKDLKTISDSYPPPPGSRTRRRRRTTSPTEWSSARPEISDKAARNGSETASGTT
ncbi:hypothetical protein RD149_07350 [Gordonia westfalica]|uniref:Uncharacterized protein n=1 Tax=Gordonia westfalica TaxID=158898 RepID=A0ABU2GQ46_9ACTN|nr:hypothetical protein [Gordonia westfalica]MDS1113583.1 hypothetical protein [Gordonia westfalica]